ncbi:MAG: hypothetical protein Q4B91_08400 [Atopobiaceae bacterium]|nr:hypothetical protein [Atopobiaceae bacterium]
MTFATAPVSRRKLASLVLLAMVTILALVGCSNLGEFDEGDVARQAERYYAEKYGEDSRVVDVWEDRSYSLFGYQSSGRAFCTMSDGQTVLVDFEEGVVGDNRQQDEITAAYEQRFREELEGCCERLGDAGCDVASVWVNGVPLEKGGFFEECISTYYWPEDPAGEKNGEAETTAEQGASFFYARYTGDDSFFEQEASRVNLGVPYVEIELFGKDADYADGFPTDVPETPAWVAPIEGACRALLPLTDGDAETRAVVYQAGCRDEVPEDTDAAVLSDAENGKLGELRPFDDSDTGAADIGSWIIVEWVPVGKGAYVTSDECGVRLRVGDVTLETVESPVSLEELRESGSLERLDEREFAPAAFEAYSLAVAPDLFARLPEGVRDNGWFDIRLAYDNQDPQTGLAELGVTPGDLAPTLYRVEKNSAEEDADNAPPYEVIAMRTETLANGYQYSEPGLHADAPTLLVRM